MDNGQKYCLVQRVTDTGIDQARLCDKVIGAPTHKQIPKKHKHQSCESENLNFWKVATDFYFWLLSSFPKVIAKEFFFTLDYFEDSQP